jgi:peptide/nickel transport system substrate-binding protein
MSKLLKLSSLVLAGVMVALPALSAELRIGMQDDPDMLDPARARTFAANIVFASVCDKLVDVTPDLKFIPQLATDWAYSDDGLTLVMHLRDGVKFQDGTPLNPEAVVYNLERSRTMTESARKSDLASLDTVKATGPLEVTFTLKNPDAAFLGQLGFNSGMMISPTAAEAEGADFGLHPVCAGPFKFVNRVDQGPITVEKFADYWNADQIFVDKITFLPIPDTMVRLSNLRAGDLDMIERLAATDVADVQADSSLQLSRAASIGVRRLAINVGHGPMSQTPIGQDKRVRQALSLSIDRAAINQVVFEGNETPGNQPWPPTSPWYDDNIPVPARDIEKAKALMAEAGQQRVALTLHHANNPISSRVAQMIQAMASEAGFDITLKATENATLVTVRQSGEYELVLLDWSGRVDPDGNIFQFVTCKGGSNELGYCNPDVDALLKKARTTLDPVERAATYDAATAILTDESPIIYYGHQSYTYAMSDKVSGFVPYPDGIIRPTGMKVAD